MLYMDKIVLIVDYARLNCRIYELTNFFFTLISF